MSGALSIQKKDKKKHDEGIAQAKKDNNKSHGEGMVQARNKRKIMRGA